MILFDYMTFDPKDEFLSSLDRVQSTELSKASSLKGRAVCVWKMNYHALALIIKPIFYITMGLLMCGEDVLYKRPIRGSFKKLGKSLILSGMVAPFGQILQLFKAAMGILHPGCYFKKDEFTVYFKKLTKIAEELGCEGELIDLIREGPFYISSSLQIGMSRFYYEALFKRDLEIICKKMTDPSLSSDEKIAILNMFASLPSDNLKSGIKSCPAGLGRLLEQICGCLDIPKDHKKVIPWLEAQLKEEFLHQIVMQIDKEKYLIMVNPKHNRKPKKHDPAHFGNFLISVLGKKIELPQEMIDQASKDMMANAVRLSDEEKEELLIRFNDLYTEEALTKYLMKRINSQADGKPGLKAFRNHIMEVLSYQISDSEIESSKKEVQKRFEIGEAVSDEPIFYVKLHYFLYPDAKPSDENASDLNAKGIKAFAATLDRNPFKYFCKKKGTK